MALTAFNLGYINYRPIRLQYIMMNRSINENSISLIASDLLLENLVMILENIRSERNPPPLSLLTGS